MKLGQWEEAEWTAGEKPLECYRIKVGRGCVWLHLRPGWIGSVYAPVWNFTCSFGCNSEDSYSGCIPGCDSLEAAKQYIHDVVIPRVGK
jgi:hypothetical protein